MENNNPLPENLNELPQASFTKMNPNLECFNSVSYKNLRQTFNGADAYGLTDNTWGNEFATVFSPRKITPPANEKTTFLE